MPTRPDLRELTTGVRDAFADADRETLLDVLSFVVKEYVVDGPPPMMLHQVETLGDLANLSFAQLIASLQTRFEHPELALFTVDGDHVSVRVGGVMQPLVAARQAPGAPAPAPVAAELPRPAAGVRVIEATLSQGRPAPAPPSAASPSPSAPRPISGMALRGRPNDSSGSAPTPPASVAAPTPAPAVAASAVPPADAKPDKPATSGDDASARFSLLELD
ncbi:MAG: hypothetical protein KBG15_01710 [Kofleriaceae bacterium]|nr:hypothetical protein [Kofleriaceae bacterium]